MTGGTPGTPTTSSSRASASCCVATPDLPPEQLAAAFERRPEVRDGPTTMCIGIGMGRSVIWENPHWDGATTTDISALLDRARAISSDAECVTVGKLRKVTLPAAANGRSAGVLGLITLDNGEDHTRPNTFGPKGLLSLNEVRAPASPRCRRSCCSPWSAPRSHCATTRRWPAPRIR